MTQKGTVSLVILGHEVVDFEWNNGCSGSFHEWAYGYLRGSMFFLRMNDEDTKIDIACRIKDEGSVFSIREVHGMHTGMTKSEDRCIDLHMLQEDADLRRRFQRNTWAGEHLHTHFECILVVTDMLKTMRIGSRVSIKESTVEVDARPLLNSAMAGHITLLMAGVTHAERGVRRMVYM